MLYSVHRKLSSCFSCTRCRNVRILFCLCWHPRKHSPINLLTSFVAGSNDHKPTPTNFPPKKRVVFAVHGKGAGGWALKLFPFLTLSISNLRLLVLFTSSRISFEALAKQSWDGHGGLSVVFERTKFRNSRYSISNYEFLIWFQTNFKFSLFFFSKKPTVNPGSSP